MPLREISEHGITPSRTGTKVRDGGKEGRREEGRARGTEGERGGRKGGPEEGRERERREEEKLEEREGGGTYTDLSGVFCISVFSTHTMYTQCIHTHVQCSLSQYYQDNIHVMMRKQLV